MMSSFFKRVEQGYHYLMKLVSFEKKHKTISMHFKFHLLSFLSFVMCVIVLMFIDDVDIDSCLKKALNFLVGAIWFFGNLIYCSYEIGTMLENGEIDDGKKGEKDENV